MAQPNIVSVATINGVSYVAALTTTLTTTLVTCAAETVCKLNVIRASNITDNDATVTFDIEVAGTHIKIANEITVPANSSVDIVDKNSSIYLMETDLLRGGCSAASTIDVLVSYETLID
tara:strand:+ start:78 stop:434 length:357 start_codon:yes stop_codon:yes gene_type:complete